MKSIFLYLKRILLVLMITIWFVFLYFLSDFIMCLLGKSDTIFPSITGWFPSLSGHMLLFFLFFICSLLFVLTLLPLLHKIWQSKST